ncbi:hypothetical protein CFC21_073615 [Triticum aestivum]|uniref:Uncharacterized protein n=3 Tax=Triticum TaxID=4564 RepID=A0A9R0XI64_TRITD|nr:uncharacterized protein LOC123113385 isoform X1 [Triticum aestivum]KAF7067773.1 hypothetical protein CFC21_073615 [Triticum aestivum]VAI36975.1 unnamed protein product [Triticum turgidum subsp. durum]
MLIVLTVILMGAKVEGESYNPGYYATGDLHMDSNGWRSPYYEDKTSNGQLYNGFMTKQADGYSEYDNETLKRTMLSHEAMFRQQVYELHRVYKIQRDLMKHYENKDAYAYPELADASQTNSSSQVPPNGSKMIWQMPLVAKTYGEATVAVHTDTNHSLKFLSDGSVLPSPNGFPSNGVALNTKQGIIDLELPADHYIDDDNTSDNKPIDFLGVDSGTKPPNDARVTFSGAEGLGRFNDNSSTSGLLTTNKPGGCHVADLNEPITGMHMGGTNGSVSRALLYTLENSWHQSAVRSSTANFGFNKEYSKEKHTDEGTSSNFLDASAKLRQEEKSLIDKGKQVSNQSFFTPRYSNVDLQKSFKVADGRSATNEFIYHGQNSSVGWFSKGPMGASPINNFARLDHPHHSSIGTPVAPISIPHIDHPSVASPIGSCTVDPRSSVINNAFQRVPSFNGSSTVNSYKSPSAVTQSIGPSIHKLKRFDNLDGSYFGFPPDPFSASRSRQQVAISSELEQRNCLMFEHSAARQSHGYPQSTNGKGTKNFNLNEALSDGLEELVEQDGRSVGSLQHSKGEGSVFGISWLKNKATCADPTGLEKQRKMLGHSNGTAADTKINNNLTGITPIVCNLSDSASTSLGCRIKIDDASEGITDRTWLVCNKTEESTTRHLPLSSQKPLDRDGQAAEGVVNKSGAAVVRNLFDLNDDVPHEDNSESSVVSHECDVAALQNNHAKRTFLFDLEEVPACEDGAAWTSQQECTPSGKLGASKEVDLCFPSATDAAQIILALSTDVPTTTGTPDDMLQWFAELAISNMDDHAEQAKVQGCIDNSSDDGSDSFEALTLKLEECKTDERWTRTPEPPLTDDDQAVSAVNLLSKPKRGPQRKRRQKRDFQKDILPGLSSLSRPKIIEDIQLIEGLVQASGGSWESSLTRRARGGRTRGRKPRKNEPATVEIEAEAEASPPSKPNSIGLEADERGMVSWGRTTRRCRKPRCPLGNSVAASS